jgi:hypothetical protein
MKNDFFQVAQGELTITRIKSLPKQAKLVTDPKKFANGAPIVGHSETGHHHVMRGEGVQFFETSDPLVCYLQISTESALTHLRDYDTHGTQNFPPGVYHVSKAREYISPAEQRMVAD